MHTRSNIYIWNPSTGLHKQIPFSPIASNLEYFYGFGYDRLTDDYLMVLMSYDASKTLATVSSHLEFFSLRDNTWKEIKGTHFPYSNPILYQPKAGLLFNEAIHWLAYHNDLHQYVVVAFDLMKRKLCNMYLPDEFDNILDYSGLWVFGEFLSFSSNNFDNHTVEIWVMKEYKVHSSWTKTHVLSIDANVNESLSFSPLCCAKSGDIIGTCGGIGLVKYNDKGQLLEHCSYRNDSRESQVAMY